jgi:imidazolonepropionase-like amidohydrolase
MERLVECGMSPLEAIRAATLNNAKALGMEGIYGTVETGKAADLLIVNGDPAAEISTVSNVHMVIQGGRIIIGPDRLE